MSKVPQGNASKSLKFKMEFNRSYIVLRAAISEILDIHLNLIHALVFWETRGGSLDVFLTNFDYFLGVNTNLGVERPQRGLPLPEKSSTDLTISKTAQLNYRTLETWVWSLSGHSIYYIQSINHSILFFFPFHMIKPPQSVSLRNTRPTLAFITILSQQQLLTSFFTLQDLPHSHPSHLRPLQHWFWKSWLEKTFCIQDIAQVTLLSQVKNYAYSYWWATLFSRTWRDRTVRNLFQAEAYLGGPLGHGPLWPTIFFYIEKLGKLGWPPPLYEH